MPRKRTVAEDAISAVGTATDALPAQKKHKRRRLLAIEEIRMRELLDYFPMNARNLIQDFISSTVNALVPLIFMWRNIHNFVISIPMVTTIPAPTWLTSSNPTVSDFKDALLNHIRFPDSPAPFEHAILPCTSSQITEIIDRLHNLEKDAWFTAVGVINPAALPLASVLVSQTLYSDIFVNAYTSPDTEGSLQLWA